MFILKILFKNAFRHKLRTLLTVLSITVALVAFGLLRTVIEAWYAGVDASSASRLVTRNAISLVFSLPLSYREKIRQVDGVKNVSYGNWFGGVYIDEKNFFPNFAVEPNSYFEMYPEFILPPDQKAVFLRDRRGAVAGRKTADAYGWKTGDIITLRGTIFPGQWEFLLQGIYRGRDKNTDESQFFFHWDYLNERMKKIALRRADQVGFYMIEVKDPGRAADVAATVDRMFQNSLAETLTETEKAFQMSFIAMTEAILIAIQFVSLVVIVIIMAVTANTMAMTVRERMGEYAVFKTLGFGGWRIVGLIFGESLVITMTGCVIAVIATFPVAKGFGEAMGTFFPVFFVTKETFALYAAAAFLVGCVAAVIPTWRTLQTSIADGLRRIG
jgi:putative ABC transport system permease protein